MKIALAQINPVIGDFAHNSRRILHWTEEAKKQRCDLVIFSELALCGYPPQDFLERERFLRDHDRALAELVAGISGIGVLCGVLERHSGPTGKFLHNSAVLFEDGGRLFTARKRLLPTYDVFDETRYFEPGSASAAFLYKGTRLGITICEDIWNLPAMFPRQAYAVDPLSELMSPPNSKPEILINLSASPYHLGKDAIKNELYSRICRRFNLPLVCVNQVGGQDSLLFDGRSLAMDRSGGEIIRAAAFQEDMVIFAAETGKGQPHDDTVTHEAIDETGELLAALVMGVRDYVGKCGFTKGVLGLSGGIDSSLTAAIACQALGPANVLGVALPSPYTAPESIEDARQLAHNLGCRFEIMPITSLFESFQDTLAPLFKELPVDVTEQNIQARIRGNLLMAMSNKFGALLLSTGNKSEMAVGYCTLYGDMSGGLAVIADLPKQLVYKLARRLNSGKETIPARVLTRPPSAELAPDQFDQDDLPPYDMLDAILAAYLEENLGVDEIVARGYNRPIVEDVVHRVRRNEYKRKQAPIGLKVTTKSFGHGWRYPTAQNYREGKIQE